MIGWYAACLARELTQRTRIKRIAGRDIVLRRAHDLAARAWAGARELPVREQDGLVLVHSDPSGAPPAWTVPPLPRDDGYSPLSFTRRVIAAEPTDVVTDLADVAHFTKTHGYREVTVPKPFRGEGAFGNVRYGITRDRDLFGLGGHTTRAELEIDAFGVGYQRVEVSVPDHGMFIRNLVLPTPRDPGVTELTLAAAVRFDDARWRRRFGVVGPALCRMPGVAALARMFALRALLLDIAVDIRAWEGPHRDRGTPELSAWLRSFAPANGS